MKQILKKVKFHYKRVQKHPLTKRNILISMWRYFYFNIQSKEQIKSWIGPLKFFLRKGDAGLVGNYYYGLYEFEESLFLLHLLNEDDLFLDIGANLGHYSLLASGIKGCRSIAVEPVPATYNRMVKNIRLNELQGIITPLPLGISDEPGRVYFSTDKNTMDRIVSSNYKNAVEVAVNRIDDILDNEIPVAIKIDVEGYEYFVLKGAERVLESFNLKVIIMELNESGKKYGKDDRVIYQLLWDKGFRPFEYDFDNRALIALSTYNKHKFNTIFVRDRSFVEKRIKEGSKIKIKNEEF